MTASFHDLSGQFRKAYRRLRKSPDWWHRSPTLLAARAAGKRLLDAYPSRAGGYEPWIRFQDVLVIVARLKRLDEDMARAVELQCSQVLQTGTLSFTVTS